MKMVLAGAWHWPMYQQTCADALIDLGVEVVPFKWNSYFQGLLGRFEAHTLISVLRIRKLNNDLVELCGAVKPDVLFVWGSMHLENESLEKIRNMGILLVSYNNDDPFAKRYSELRYVHLRGIWRKFIRNLPLYHLNFVYRKKNIKDYRKQGLCNVELLQSYYSPELHYPLNLQKGTDFEGVFVGHYERDERFRCIKALQDAGIKVKIYGSGWGKCREIGCNYLDDIQTIHGTAYNKALNRAHFALCFFSKLNNDQYTRRAFEIPATGTLLVSKRTDEMELLYKDSEEAIFFDDADELVVRMKKMQEDTAELERVAKNGYQRCLSSGYDVKSRMEYMLSHIRRVIHEKSTELHR